MTTPSHLAALPGADWSLWRWVCVRGAGFPIRLVLELGAPDATRAASVVGDAEREVTVATRAAVEALNALPATGERLRALLKVKRDLQRGHPPECPVDDGGPVDQAVARLRDALAKARDARSAYAATFEDAVARSSASLRRAATDARFREALTWQNLHALGTALDPLLRAPPSERSNRVRTYEGLVLSYLQRYCTKNDTIGFFGPWAWAQARDEGPPIALRRGPRFLRSRHVHFEQWPIDAVADSLAEDGRILAWTPPRRHPLVRIEGSVAHHPVEGAIELSRAEALALAACDGDRLPSEIAASLLAAHGDVFELDSDVEEALRALADRGLLLWRFRSPMAFDPDRLLRERIARIGDDELRSRATERLDRLDEGRAAVAAAAGDTVALGEAVRALERLVADTTGASATRLAGQMYAGRGVVFEDTVRDADIELGPAWIDAIAAPLNLVLASARWLTHETARAYREAFAAIHGELAGGADGTVPFVAFWLRAQRVLYGSKTRPVDAVTSELQRRWAELLPLPADARRVDFASADLAARVEATFAAPNGGWQSARYHSPDLMVAARGLDAFQRGEFLVVMGETHVGSNTVDQATCVMHHPDSASLLRAVEQDVPETRVFVARSRQWPKVSVRTLPMLATEKDFWFEATEDEAPAPRGRVLQPADLDLVGSGGALRVRAKDGRLDVDVVDFLAEELAQIVVSRFSIFPPMPRRPRVTIDRLVVARESWSFAPSQLAFAFEAAPASRFLGARRWAEAAGLPRFVFAKSAVELKPFYVDLESPALIELFCKVVRKAKEKVGGETPVGLTEMLPGPEELWLEDDAGDRYTCELRTFAVDARRSGR
jgi:hypothetical protein